MKKLISLFLAAFLTIAVPTCISPCVNWAAVTVNPISQAVNDGTLSVLATPTSSSVVVNNIEMHFTAYNINDNNYFKLRDLAFAVNGSEKQFDIAWDENRNAINLTSKKAYTPVGGEMAVSGSQAEVIATETSSRVYIDGQEVSLKGYRIGDSNYFKLRDVMLAFHIGLVWEESTNTIRINSRHIPLVQLSLDGMPTAGSELSAVAVPQSADVRYQWQSSADNVNFTNIPGATTGKYVPVASDIGKYIRLVATDEADNTKAKSVTAAERTAGSRYISSNAFPDDYIKVSITNNNIDIKLKSCDDTEFSINLVSSGGIQIINEFNSFDSSGNYAFSRALTNIEDGDYKFSYYTRKDGTQYYMSELWDIPMTAKAGQLYFTASPILDNNLEKNEANKSLNPQDFLQSEISDDEKHAAVVKLSDSITGGIKDDYQKLRAIHDWVANNIYYDWDSYLSGKYGATDAYGTMINKRSVCQGYAELTSELVRAAGIPCRLVSGHAIWLSSQWWDNVDHTVTDHAWNEAYIDGRWVTLDTTWDSGNKYENGMFNSAGKIRYIYFDPTIEVFSLDHKVIY